MRNITDVDELASYILGQGVQALVHAGADPVVTAKFVRYHASMTSELTQHLKSTIAAVVAAELRAQGFEPSEDELH